MRRKRNGKYKCSVFSVFAGKTGREPAGRSLGQLYKRTDPGDNHKHMCSGYPERAYTPDDFGKEHRKAKETLRIEQRCSPFPEKRGEWAAFSVIFFEKALPDGVPFL